MGIAPDKRFDKLRGVSGKYSRSNVEYQDYEDEVSGYQGGKNDQNAYTIVEEDEDSFKEEKDTKLPAIKPSKANPRASSMKNPKNSRYNIAHNINRDGSAESAKKKGQHQPSTNKEDMERKLSAMYKSEERGDSNYNARNNSASHLDKVTNLQERKDTESSRKIPDIDPRDSPFSGITKTSKRSKRKPTGPNDFEKWFNKNKNTGVYLKVYLETRSIPMKYKT